MEIRTIENKGDQTKEQVTLKVLADCDVGKYILFDSTYTADGKVSNRVRHAYWFPDKLVKAGDFLVLHTGAGQQKSHLNQAGSTTHLFYWGLKEAVWNDDGDFATLVESNAWISKKVG